MKNNYNLLVFFLTNALFLGGGISIIFSYTEKDSYIAFFLGTMIGIIILYIINKINHSNLSTNILFKTLYLLFLLFIITILLISLSTFLYSFFLPFTPVLISCAPLVLIACLFNSKSITKILYVAIPLFIFSIALILTKSILLIKEVDFNNIAPIFTVKYSNFIKGIITYAVLATTPNLLLINEETSFKISLKYYLIASSLLFIFILLINLVLGNLSIIFSYPEYAVLRRIKVLDFIENIENFVSITWIFDIFITLSLASLKLKQTLNTNNKYISAIIALIILVIIYQNVSSNLNTLIIIYKLFPFIAFIFLITFTAIYLINTKKHEKSAK